MEKEKMEGRPCNPERCPHYEIAHPNILARRTQWLAAYNALTHLLGATRAKTGSIWENSPHYASPEYQKVAQKREEELIRLVKYYCNAERERDKAQYEHCDKFEVTIENIIFPYTTPYQRMELNPDVDGLDR